VAVNHGDVGRVDTFSTSNITLIPALNVAVTTVLASATARGGHWAELRSS